MSPTAHSRFPASAAARLLACPGSYRLAAEAEEAAGGRRASVYAAEGTLAHSLAETCLLTGTEPEAFVGASFRADGHDFVVDEAYALALGVYVDLLRGLCALGYHVCLEERVDPSVQWDGLDPLPIPLFGTADCIAYDPRSRQLVVADLKFGRGIAVEAPGNPQLLYYAAGAAHSRVVDRLCAESGVRSNGVEGVRLIVCQPRSPHPEGPIRQVDYTFAEIREWARDVLYPGVRRALDDAGRTLVAGEHCRWCAYAPHCPRPRELSLSVATTLFSGAPVENIPEPDPTQGPGQGAPVLLDDSELGALLDRIEIVRPWIEAVRQMAQDRLAAGADVPGWALVPTRPVRRWDPDRSEGEILSALISSGLSVDDVRASRLLSPAQVRNRVGDKRYRALVEQFVVRQSGSMTLVPRGDPRARLRAVRPAAEAFGTDSEPVSALSVLTADKRS